MTNALPHLDDLIACPECDTLHLAQDLPEGMRASCRRCGYLLMTSRQTAVARIIALALTAVVLMIAAVTFPFLSLNVQGVRNATSVLDAVLAFSDGLAFPLAIATAFFIIVLPLMRLVALIYALGPLMMGRRPTRLSRVAFALAERLRPWSMAEIFIVGVAVALIKVVGMATVTVGPAFWAFAGVVVITILKDQLICRYSIWETLDQNKA
jgi:paraquat-inducible protein A